MKEAGRCIIEAINVGKRVSLPHGELSILDDISFAVAPAEAVAILGVSGSGKSTLLSLLAGLDVASAGQILLDGRELGALSEDERAGLRNRLVGFVFQSFQLLANLTALENVMLPLELAGEPAAAGRAREALAEVGLADRTAHYPAQLSGGEQQRVALARAFVTTPGLLFADEPTGSLDTTNATAIADLLFSLRERHGTTLVLVTHDERLAARCDRVLRIAGGRLA